MRWPLFAYGTLKRGYALHESLVDEFGADFDFEGEVITTDNFGIFDLGPYPLMVSADQVPDEFRGQVLGELYWCSQAALRAVTAVEYGAGYAPIAIDLIAADRPIKSALSWLHPVNHWENHRWVRPANISERHPQLLSWRRR